MSVQKEKEKSTKNTIQLEKTYHVKFFSICFQDVKSTLWMKLKKKTTTNSNFCVTSRNKCKFSKEFKTGIS